MQKKRAEYRVDSNNRLILTTAKGTVRPRGTFSLDSRNRLIFFLNEPVAWKKRYETPSKIITEGAWSLNKNYDLVLRYRRYATDTRSRRLVFRGKILKAHKDALVFEVRGADRDNTTSVSLLTLNGYWKADKNNRIGFTVKNKPAPDTLTLGSNWDIGKDYQLVYSYEKQDLKTKRKKVHALLFKGHWHIDRTRTLTYILEESSRSRFDFRAQLQTPTLYPKPGEIRYRVGSGFSLNRSARDTFVTLYGEWKLGKEKEIFFDIDYGKNGRKKIAFTYSFFLNRKNEVILSLANGKSEPLGMSLTINRFFLTKSCGKTFLRLKNYTKEKRIEAGVSFSF